MKHGGSIDVIADIWELCWALTRRVVQEVHLRSLEVAHFLVRREVIEEG